MSRMNAGARRKQLLEAAVDCFAKRGYRGATTAELAKAAGVTEPILYRHFASKQALFVALLEFARRESLAAWGKAIAPLTSPIDRLRVLLRLNPATDPHLGRIYSVIFHAQSEISEPTILNALRRHYERYARFLENLLVDAQRSGLVRRDVMASGLAWQLVHSAIGFAFVKPLGIPGHATPAAVEQAIGLLLEQLAGEPTLIRRSAPRRAAKAKRRRTKKAHP